MREKGSFRRFGRDERGVALVEFALALPLMLIFLFVTIESCRMIWHYQMAAAGVRDAARYAARAEDLYMCSGSANGTVLPFQSVSTGELMDIIDERFDTGNGSSSLFDGRASGIDSVSGQAICRVGAFRNPESAVAQVSATLTIQYPFSGILAWVGSVPTSTTTTITESAKVYGF